MSIFDDWNLEKQKINRINSQNFYIRPREIWFTKMGKNIGFEQDGKEDFLRPVVVLKKIGNLFFTVALTSRGKVDHPFYYFFKDLDLIEKNIKYKNSSYAVLSQVKVMNKKRFTQYIGRVSQLEFGLLKEKLKTILF